jgi:hypothetical protein
MIIVFIFFFLYFGFEIVTNNWDKRIWSEVAWELFLLCGISLVSIMFIISSYNTGLKRIIGPANLLFVYTDNKLSVFENGVALNEFLISEDTILSTRKENQRVLAIPLPQKKLLSFHTKNLIVSILQRQLKIGYNRATRFALKLEPHGIVRFNNFGILEMPFSSIHDFNKHFEKIENEFYLEMKEDLAYIKETLDLEDYVDVKDVILMLLFDCQKAQQKIHLNSNKDYDKQDLFDVAEWLKANTPIDIIEYNKYLDGYYELAVHKIKEYISKRKDAKEYTSEKIQALSTNGKCQFCDAPIPEKVLICSSCGNQQKNLESVYYIIGQTEYFGLEFPIALGFCLMFIGAPFEPAPVAAIGLFIIILTILIYKLRWSIHLKGVVDSYSVSEAVIRREGAFFWRLLLVLFSLFFIFTRNPEIRELMNELF